MDDKSNIVARIRIQKRIIESWKRNHAIVCI